MGLRGKKTTHEGAHWLCYINIKTQKNSFSCTLVNVRRIFYKRKKKVSRKPGCCTVLKCMKIVFISWGNCKVPGHWERKMSQPEACWAELKGRSWPSICLSEVLLMFLSLMQKPGSHGQWYQSLLSQLKMKLNKKTNKETTKPATIKTFQNHKSLLSIQWSNPAAQLERGGV